MPLKPASGDARLLLRIVLAAAVLFVIAAVLLPPPGPALTYPASESPASGGGLAAFDLLRASGYRIERWRLPPGNLPAGRSTVLILAEPFLAPPPLSPDYGPDRAALRRFLAGGGAILATGPFAANLLPRRAGCAPAPMSAVPVLYRPLLAGEAAARGIALQPECSWRLGDPAVLPLYGDAHRAVVVRLLGRGGRIEWWSSATPLTNAGIAQTANLRLLLQAVGPPGRRILWDEYFHGEAPSWIAYLGAGVLPWALLPLGLLLFAALWSYGRRLAPAAQPAAAARQSPLEFTAGIGSLYERARDPELALDVIRQVWRRRLACGPAPAAPPPATAAKDEAAALAEYRRLALALAATDSEVPNS
jgi:hypothetical protein